MGGNRLDQRISGPMIDGVVEPEVCLDHAGNIMVSDRAPSFEQQILRLDTVGWRGWPPVP